MADKVPHVEWSKRYTLPQDVAGVKFSTRSKENQDQVAPKFRMTQIVQIKKARQMAFNAAGTVMFVGSRDANGYSPVYAVFLTTEQTHVEDGTQQYSVDVTKVLRITDDMAMPSGVAYDDSSDTLFVGIVTGIMRYDNAIARLTQSPDEKLTGQRIFETPNGKMNSWKYLKLVQDAHGKKRLLFPIGSPCDSCETELPYSTINMIDLDGSGYTPLVQGVRNSVGFATNPAKDGQLWFTDCAHDSDILPPCDELNKIDNVFELANSVTNDSLPSYGFPFCHSKNVPSGAHNPAGDCKAYVAPQYCLGTHVAALGMTFYDAEKYSMMPREVVGTKQDVVIVAEHGSWNRDPQVGYRITTVNVQDPSEGSYQTFMEGMDVMDPNGRPVDVQVFPHDRGSLFISDDGRNAIYRVTYGYKATDEEDPDNSSSASTLNNRRGTLLTALLLPFLVLLLLTTTMIM